MKEKSTFTYNSHKVNLEDLDPWMDHQEKQVDTYAKIEDRTDRTQKPSDHSRTKLIEEEKEVDIMQLL